ncbi:MAG: ABC transporter permease subunit [Deltaproteobacteria bacterium]|nr:MAG: ABC transporter permease subunit [Deltaproteobacteria bacterium]
MKRAWIRISLGLLALLLSFLLLIEFPELFRFWLHSLLVCLLCALVVGTLGTLLGVLAGYYRGGVEGGIQQTIRLIEALPRVVVVWLLLFVLGDRLGTDPAGVRLVKFLDTVATGLLLGVLCLPIIIRTITERIEALLGENYVMIQRVQGVSERKVFWVLLTRNALESIILALSYIVGFALILDTNIGFLYNQAQAGGGLNHVTLGMKISASWELGPLERGALFLTVLLILGFYWLGEGILFFLQERRRQRAFTLHRG